MSARFVPLTEGVAPTIPLQRPVILVGRHPDCDVRINLPQISRRHCCIAMAYSRLILRDLGSRNGVRVNGRRVDEIQLSAGDEVAIGQIIYRLEIVEPAPVRSEETALESSDIAPKPVILPALPPNPGDLGPNSLTELFPEL